MASISQVGIELQVRGEREATQALKRYSDSSDKLTRSVLNAAGKVENTTNAWDRANRLYEKGILNTQGLKAAQTQLARELAVVNGYTKSNGALNTQKALAELRAAQATREAAQAAKENAAAEAAANAERMRAQQSYNQLRMSIDKSYAARMRLKQAADTLRAAVKAEIITREQAIEQLRQYRATSQMVTAATGVGSAANQRASRKINEVGMAVQQTGYQVGDFLVQIQSGTNAFVAFGQQATQLVGILPMFASVLKVSVGTLIGISSVLGIVIPLATALGAAFMRTRQEAESASDGVDSFASALESARSSISSMKFELEALNAGFENTEEFALFRAMKEAERQVDETKKKLQEIGNITISPGAGPGPGTALLILNNQLEEQEAALTKARREFEEYTDAQERIKNKYDDILGSAEGLAAANEALNDIEQERIEKQKEQQQRVNEIRRAMGLVRSETTTLSQYTADVASELGLGYQEALKLQVEMEKSEDYALGITRADMASGILAASAQAAILAKNMGISLGLALELVELAGKSRAENLFDAKIRAGIIPPQASGDFNLEGGGQTPFELRQYMEAVDARVRAREEASRSGGGSGGGAAREQVDYLTKLQKEADLKLSLVGLSEEQQRYEEIRAELVKQGLPVEEERIQKLLATEVALREATEAETRRQDLMQTVNNSIEQSLMSLIDGSKSVEDAMTGMIRAILQEIAMQSIVKPIASAITGSFFADGAAFNGGRVVPFADGGVVSSPTMFPMTGNQTGLMGEAGPEAIMPLKRGKGGKLGVVAEGASQPVVIHQNFNFSANGDDSVKRIIAEEAPKIANLTQKQIMDQRRRGGAMKSTFG